MKERVGTVMKPTAKRPITAAGRTRWSVRQGGRQKVVTTVRRRHTRRPRAGAGDDGQRSMSACRDRAKKSKRRNRKSDQLSASNVHGAESILNSTMYTGLFPGAWRLGQCQRPPTNMSATYLVVPPGRGRLSDGAGGPGEAKRA
jgi:hypothetical protein